MLSFLSRAVGLLFLAGALVAFVVDGARSIADARLVLTPLGQTWYDLSPGTLNLSQAVIQRYLHPVVWDPVIQWILGLPAVLVLTLLGAAFVWLGSRRRRRTRYQAS